MGTNVSYTIQPKFVSPFGDNEVYFVPALKDQEGTEGNYIVVTCSPSYNGIGRYPAKNVEHYHRWLNKKLVCLYVPVSDCEFFQELDDITTQPMIDKIQLIQQKWFKKSDRKKTPKWML